jgi:hypothetical protein
MTEYVWYDQTNDELFINYIAEDLILFGERLLPDCVCLGELYE